MNYKDYIESINPPEDTKDRVLESAKKRNKKRIAFKSLLTAAAVFAVVLTAVLSMNPGSPKEKTVLPTEITTKALINNYISDGDTVKSIPIILIVNESRYIEDIKNRIEVSESGLIDLGTVTESSFTSPDEVDTKLLGAQIFGIEGDSRILVKSNGNYYLFNKTE